MRKWLRRLVAICELRWDMRAIDTAPRKVKVKVTTSDKRHVIHPVFHKVAMVMVKCERGCGRDAVHLWIRLADAREWRLCKTCSARSATTLADSHFECEDIIEPEKAEQRG